MRAGGHLRQVISQADPCKAGACLHRSCRLEAAPTFHTSSASPELIGEYQLTITVRTSDAAEMLMI